MPRADTVTGHEIEDKTEKMFKEYFVTGDLGLRSGLVGLHKNLVRFLAGKFINRGEPIEDLIQVGTIGLINAIDRFDPFREIKFSTYATPTITGEIRRHFRDKAWKLKVPRRLQELNLASNKATEQLSQKLGRAPTVIEIAHAVNASEEETMKAIELGNAYETVSLDTKLAYEGESTPLSLSEFVGELDEGIEDAHKYADVRYAISSLDARERAIVECRFFRDMSQTETAKYIVNSGVAKSMSQMHVSRLQEKILAKLAGMIGDRDVEAVEDKLLKIGEGESKTEYIPKHDDRSPYWIVHLVEEALKKTPDFNAYWTRVLYDIRKRRALEALGNKQAVELTIGEFLFLFETLYAIRIGQNRIADWVITSELGIDNVHFLIRQLGHFDVLQLSADGERCTAGSSMFVAIDDRLCTVARAITKLNIKPWELVNLKGLFARREEYPSRDLIETIQMSISSYHSEGDGRVIVNGQEFRILRGLVMQQFTRGTFKQCELGGIVEDTAIGIYKLNTSKIVTYLDDLERSLAIERRNGSIRLNCKEVEVRLGNPDGEYEYAEGRFVRHGQIFSVYDLASF